VRNALKTRKILQMASPISIEMKKYAILPFIMKGVGFIENK
jgi:hypothetical protein